MTEFDEIHARVGFMHGYAMEKCPTCGSWIRDPTARPGARCECGAMAVGSSYANGLSQPCRANRHDECVDAGCVCPCHTGDDE